MFSYEVTKRNLCSFDNMSLYKPKPNYEIFKHSLQFRGAEIWNTLPLHVKESTSLSDFKHKCKSYIYDC